MILLDARTLHTRLFRIFALGVILGVIIGCAATWIVVTQRWEQREMALKERMEILRAWK